MTAVHRQIDRHIDVGSVLRGAVCDLYSNLVTRPTGAAVRAAIEAMLGESSSESDQGMVITIDFSRVNLLDFSCADEIVAKLLLQHVDASPPLDRFVTFRGMREDHIDAVQAVLERRTLALIWERDGMLDLLGAVDTESRRHRETVRAMGPVWPASVAETLALSVADSERQLETLWRRRLLMRTERGFLVPMIITERAA
jgi:hypothetical protein